MKYFLLLSLCSLSFSTLASTLKCKVDNRFNDEHTIMEGDVGIEIKTTAFCNKKSYQVTIHGGGIGLYGALADGFLVYCPFQNELTGHYYGLSVKAALAAGLGIGAFASDEGFCVIGRGSYGLGASVEGARLTIKEVL